ncbi:head-tail connector protein [Brucella tritici]|uniref:head-tail connector protein n=1 Tax=Brucella tritici TaxID=94626 RepID=UPI003D6CF491
MWHPYKVAQESTGDVIALDDVKRHLNVMHDDDDVYIRSLIAAATDFVEKYCGIVIAEQTIEASCDAFSDMSRLPVGPVSEVVKIEYIAPDGSKSSVSADAYVLNSDAVEPSIVQAYGGHWPIVQPGSRIAVTMNAGFNPLPTSIRHAMLLWIADAYLVRANSATVEWSAFDSLLCNYRRGR